MKRKINQILDSDNEDDSEILDYEDNELNIWDEMDKSDKFEIEEIMNLNIINNETRLNENTQDNVDEIIENNNYNPISIVDKFLEGILNENI